MSVLGGLRAQAHCTPRSKALGAQGHNCPQRALPPSGMTSAGPPTALAATTGEQLQSPGPPSGSHVCYLVEPRWDPIDQCYILTDEETEARRVPKFTQHKSGPARL